MGIDDKQTILKEKIVKVLLLFQKINPKKVIKMIMNFSRIWVQLYHQRNNPKKVYKKIKKVKK